MDSNKTTDVTIKKMVNGGYGLSVLNNGKTALVLYGLPGETIRLKIVDTKQSVCYGVAREIIGSPHPLRIQPACPYYMTCGGCNLQHADYELQCSIKTTILADLLERSGSQQLQEQAVFLEQIVPSSSLFNYRQRIRLKITNTGLPGFNRFRSHEVTPVKHCLLAPKHINHCLEQLPTLKSFQTLAGISTEIELLSNPADNSLCLRFFLLRKPRPTDRKAARTLGCSIATDARIFLVGRSFSDEGPFGETEQNADNLLCFSMGGPDPLTLSWEAGGFCQVNIEQNRQLVELVLQLSSLSPNDRVLDLYCGMGNFSIPAALLTSHVHGVESQGSAIRSARRNAEHNNVKNMSFTKSDVPAACLSLIESGEQFDTIICDPPRQGMVNLSAMLHRLTRKRLVYISCDPATLCRDLKVLCESGFSIKSIRPVDMFPQTHHIETVTLLELH